MIEQGYKNLHFLFSLNSHKTWFRLQRPDNVDELEVIRVLQVSKSTH